MSGSGSRAASIERDLGEALATVRNISDQLKELREEATRREGRLTDHQMTTATALSAMRDEQSRTTATINARLDNINSQVRELDDKSRGIAGDVGSLKSELVTVKTNVVKLETPVHRLVEQRNSIAKYVVVIAGVGSFLWYIIGPHWTEIVKILFGK